jgi:hypothetical protein
MHYSKVKYLRLRYLLNKINVRLVLGWSNLIYYNEIHFFLITLSFKTRIDVFREMGNQLNFFKFSLVFLRASKKHELLQLKSYYFIALL